MSPAPSSPINFWNVLAPDQAVEQAQIDRRRALAQALMGQSLQSDVPQRGAMSWTQGAARLAQALSAGFVNRRADKQQPSLNQQLASQLRGNFGHYGSGPNPDGTMSATSNVDTPPQAPDIAAPGPVSAGTAPSSLPAPPATPAPRPANTGQVSEVPGDSSSTFDQAFGPDTLAALQNGTPLPPIPQPQSAAPSVAAAPPAAAANPPAPPTAPSQPWQPGPWSLTGDPSTDMSLAAGMGLPAYLAKVADARMPTDFTRQLQQAGIDPKSYIARQLMQDQIGKLNYIAPATARGNSWSQNPTTGAWSYHPAIPEGGEPVFDGNGNVVGVKSLDGSLKLIEDVQGAKTRGQNRYEPITGYDANNRPVFTNKTDAAGGGAAGSGSIVRPSLPPGYSAASDSTGKASAQVFQNISDMGADVPNRINALRQMQSLVNDPHTVLGPGSAQAANIKGILGTIAQSWGGQAPTSVTNAAEFSKWASQYSARTAQELGLSGSDTRVQIAVHASPNGEMTRGALQAVLPQFIGMENAKQGYANAAVAWQQAHGPDTAQQFRTTWNRVFDPRLYAWSAEGPQSLTSHMQGLSKSDAITLRNKYLTLKQMGAI